MKTKSIVSISMLTLLLISCGTNQETTENTSSKEQKEENSDEIKRITHQFSNVNAGVAKHINLLIDNYLILKDNLVKTDANSASKSATELKKLTIGFDNSQLPSEQKAVYEENIKEIQTQLDSIIKLSDIAQQRESFAILTDNVYGLAKAFGYSKILYHEHCPMALNDKGAMWLSTENEIKNPYFGDEMLSCGSVKEEIK